MFKTRIRDHFDKVGREEAAKHVRADLMILPLSNHLWCSRCKVCLDCGKEELHL